MPTRRHRHLLASVVIILAAATVTARADPAEQTIDELRKTAPKVFIDCERCDINFIREEITFVNYVRDRLEADVHVLVTQQSTGGGGQEYTISFIGQKECSDLKNTLKYYSNRVETGDEVRRGLVQILKLGLAPFVARTPMAKTVNMTLSQKVKSTSVEDKWNFWVFNVSARSRLQGEETRKSAMISSSVSVNRITPASKFRTSVWASYDKSVFDYGDEYYESSSNSKSVDSLYVRSLNDHWSVGGIVNVSSSTYSNLGFSLSVHPAVEYDLFHYSESTRRQLRFLYRVGYNYDRYIEETIYQKLSDTLWNEALTVTLEFTEPWGNAEISVEGSHYFDSFKYNRVAVFGDLSLRLIRGLSLNVSGRYSKVRDQINLAAGDATLEELLLRRKELASGFRYGLSVGLSYSFGSVYSNVVNPRFGSGARYEGMYF